MIYTFYSYKGGVGRSMALVNTAELFYQAGLKVLMVDWDLEAPGLERWFFHDPEQLEEVLDQRGLMDMFLGYKKQMAQEAAISVGAQGELPFEDPRHVTINIYPEGTGKGQLWLLSAGRRSRAVFADYARSVLTFDWQDFYQNWGGERYIEWLRRQFVDMADIVLVDSRTGVTELGGICTYQLADTVIMFCSPSQQSLDGTHKMALNFTDPQVQNLRSERPLNLMILPARVENTESDALDAFQAEFRRLFKPFLPSSADSDFQQFWGLSIPYIPKYAYKELIAVCESDKASAENMVTAFRRLQRMIRRQRVERLVHSDPERVARELALALGELRLHVHERENREDLFQIETLVETFAGELAGFEPLLRYAWGMAELARGDTKGAADQIGKVLGMGRTLSVVDVSLPIPTQIIEHIEASQRVGQARKAYQRDYEQHKQTIRTLLEQAKDSTSPVCQLLALLQAALEAEDYREILRLSKDPGLKQPAGEPQTREVQPVIEKLVLTVRGGLDTSIQFARELGPQQAEAQVILDTEVLQRYPDYPPARELQREWERETIRQGLQDDEDDYRILEDLLGTLGSDFWSDNMARQMRATEQARKLDLDALLTCAGLERAEAAVARFHALESPDAPDLQLFEHMVHERQMRRRPVRLRVLLYRNDLERFDHEKQALVAQSVVSAHLLQPLERERQALGRLNEALVAFENGDWELTRAIAQAAEVIYPNAARIKTLAEQALDVAVISTELDNQIPSTRKTLVRLTDEPNMHTSQVAQMYRQLERIGQQVEQYNYLKRQYSSAYEELWQSYTRCWQGFCTRAVEQAQRSYEQRSINRQMVDQLERLLEITPSSAGGASQAAELQGWSLLSQARVALQSMRLEVAADLLAQATRVLTLEDQRLETLHYTVEYERRSVESIHQVFTRFERLRNWLAEQRRPDWTSFTTDCQNILDLLDEVESDICVEQLSRLAEAIRLLERYRDAYQQLDRVLERGQGQPGDTSGDAQAIKEFQMVWAEIQTFQGKANKLLEELATSVQASYDRMNRLMKYISIPEELA